MSKVRLVPVSVFDGLPLAPVAPVPHPERKGVEVFHYSIETFLEQTKAAVGALYAFYSAHRYGASFVDKKLPYGTVCVVGQYDLEFADYLVVTNDGWEWLHGGSMSCHLAKQRKDEEAARLQTEIQMCELLQKFPEETRKYFYHEGLKLN